MVPATATSPDQAGDPVAPPWRMRVEEPTNRYLYYPIARALVRLLVHTPVTANQVTLVQPLLAVVAAALLASGRPDDLVLALAAFELRSLLDCVDGSLARAKQQCSYYGHALDAFCDWLSVAVLFCGLYLHFAAQAPPAGAWSARLSMGGVLALSLGQGAVRSAAADYFKRKLGSILEDGSDSTVEGLRELVRTLPRRPSLLQRAEVWVGKLQHLAFHLEWFDADRTQALTAAQLRTFSAGGRAPLTRLIARLWSVSNGDFYVRVTVVSFLLGHAWIWQVQLFFASAGVLWIAAMIGGTIWYLRRALGDVDEVTE